MKKALIILAVLVICLISLSIYWQNSNGSKDSIKITFGEKSKTFSMRKIEKLPHQKVVTTRDDKIYSGIKLEDLLSDFDLSKVNSAYFTSSDGMSMMIKKAEFTKAFLCKREKGKEKYYQLILTNDAFGQRWIKYISLIELR